MENDGYFSVRGFDETYDGINPQIEKRFLNNSDCIDAKLVILRHVLEHIPQPHKFLAMLQGIFPKAFIYIEVPNYDWIIENQTFFDITYEHVNYFSQSSLLSLFDNSVIKSGLLFGEQYQYVIAELSAISETFSGFYDDSNLWEYIDFNKLFPRITDTISAIEELLSENSKLYVWGGATKGCMFLVHCQNMNRLIDKVGFVVDINPNKTGKYLPHSHILVKNKAEFYINADISDVLLITNPMYKDEILADLKCNNLANINIFTL